MSLAIASSLLLALITGHGVALSTTYFLAVDCDSWISHLHDPSTIYIVYS